MEVTQEKVVAEKPMEEDSGMNGAATPEENLTFPPKTVPLAW